MLRFAGIMTGATLAGVVLQAGLDRHGDNLPAYLNVFLVLAAITAAGVLLGIHMRGEAAAKLVVDSPPRP